jgi:hypothetical protein
VSSSPKPGSFEDFARWLGEAKRSAVPGAPEPSADIRDAARAAWRDFQAVRRSHRQELLTRVRGGTYFEELELLAAADADRTRWLPRLRTPNGFAISALYAANSPPGASPVGLLVECPADLVEAFKGREVHVLAGGQWIALGEIDEDGKSTGDVPAGTEFKPPFGFRVGKLEENPEELRDPDEPR